jgi:hypothetical protein
MRALAAGVILLQLLTAIDVMRVVHAVEEALKGPGGLAQVIIMVQIRQAPLVHVVMSAGLMLPLRAGTQVMDPRAGAWPDQSARELAKLGLQCAALK